MGRNLFRPAAALAVVAFLVLAGCGEDDETTSAGAAGAQATAPSTSAAPTTVTTVAATTSTAAAQRCTNVTFSSDAEDVASDIRATGLSCADAEALVRKVGPLVSAPVGGPARVEVDGFVCNRLSTRAGDHGPPLSPFECTNGAMKVSFTRALTG